MLKLILMSSLVASMLMGCDSGTPPMPVNYPIPANLTADCPMLPQAASGVLPELLRNHVAVAGLYHDCADRHKSLAGMVILQEFLQEGTK